MARGNPKQHHTQKQQCAHQPIAELKSELQQLVVAVTKNLHGRVTDIPPLLFLETADGHKRCVDLSEMCEYRGEARHEWMHALGFVLGKQFDAPVVQALLVSEAWVREAGSDEIVGEIIAIQGMNAVGDTVCAHQNVNRDSHGLLLLGQPEFAASDDGSSLHAYLMRALFNGLVQAQRAA